MIRQFLLDYSNFQVNSNVWFDRERNFIIFGQVETGFRLTGIAAYAVYGQVEASFGWLELRICSIRSSRNKFLVDWDCACIKWSQVETSFRLTATALVLKEVKSNHIYSWSWLYYLQFKPGIAIFLLDRKCLNCSDVNCII